MLDSVTLAKFHDLLTTGDLDHATGNNELWMPIATDNVSRIWNKTDTNVSPDISTQSADFCQRLQQWVVDWAIPSTQVNALLDILQDYFTNIPTNAHSLLKADQLNRIPDQTTPWGSSNSVYINADRNASTTPLVSSSSTLYSRSISDQIPPIESPFRPPPFSKPLYMDHIDLTYHKSIRLNCGDLNPVQEYISSSPVSEDLEPEDTGVDDPGSQTWSGPVHRLPRLQLSTESEDESDTYSGLFDWQPDKPSKHNPSKPTNPSSWPEPPQNLLNTTKIDDIAVQEKPHISPSRQQQNSFSQTGHTTPLHNERIKQPVFQHKVAPRIMHLMRLLCEPLRTASADMVSLEKDQRNSN